MKENQPTHTGFALPYQEFVFEQDLKPFETDLLRTAVLKLIDTKEGILYHNHKKDGFLYSYPLIQYKSIFGKAAIVYLGKAIGDIGNLFGNINQEVEVEGKKISFRIKKIYAQLYQLRVLDYYRNYNLIQWLPLQNENYTAYANIEGDKEKEDFLKKILTGNILSFAEGVGWSVRGEIRIENFEIKDEKWTSFKGHKFLAFNINFDTNVFLPPHIGLGKGAAHNYGVVYPLKKTIV